MRRIVSFAKGASAVLALSAATVVVLSAQTFQTLYSFDHSGQGSPLGLIQAQNGELYGATGSGSANSGGTLFKITTNGTLTTLHDFCAQKPCTDGWRPATPIQTPSGELYGTTAESGPGFGAGGTVYKLTPAGDLTTLYSFCAQSGCLDGSIPSGLVRAPDGVFYGGTGIYGAYGAGTIFRITPDGALTTLYSFCAQSGCPDGASPKSTLVWSTNGDLYGTTPSGGAYNQGTVFKITPDGTLTTLHSFCAESGCLDGSTPYAALVQAANGNFYGTTQNGGASNEGTLFEMTPDGALTTLFNFCAACPAGSNPVGALIQATDGALYGTTGAGGAHGKGAVFKFVPNGTLTTLYSFCSESKCTDGGSPPAGLVQDTNGVFYGTTADGGAYGYGTVYSLSVGLGPFVAPQTTYGKIGATVQILGTNLTGVSSVTFNGTAAEFTVNETGSAIAATVPAGASSGSVQVTTPGGTLSSNVPFRIIP